ncbi:MAG: hypothetical protein U0929_07255 [Planctomycetaceae bacterium]
MSASPASPNSTHPASEQSGAQQIAALMDQVRSKDALVMQLTERLEAAAEQLDRLQRSGADKARPGGGGGGSSRELLEQTGQLTTRVEEALECWNQSSGHYEHILQRLDEISQHIFSAPEGGGGEARPARPASAPTSPASGGSAPAGGAGQAGGSFWERMKASMVDGAPPPPMPNAKPVQATAHDSEDCETSATEESIDAQLAAIEEVTPAPTVIDIDTASIEELRTAVSTRDEYISALIREFRQIQIMPPLPEDLENSGLAPAELLASLKELETRFKTGIQRENFELSLERARMGRERSRLDQVKAQLEGQIKRLAASVGERPETPSTAHQSPAAEPSIAEGKLSWLKRLQPKKPQN